VASRRAAPVGRVNKLTPTMQTQLIANIAPLA
jgi:hypothetical protein